MGYKNKVRYHSNITIIVAAILGIVLIATLFYTRNYIQMEKSASDTGNFCDSKRSSSKSDLNYYLGWIFDDAQLFSVEIESALAYKNLTVDNTYDSLIAVKTVSFLNGKDIQSFAEEVALELGLDQRDMLLFLDSNSQSWYVTYGAGLVPYVEANADLPNIFRTQLGSTFWDEGNANKAILTLFDELDAWYRNNVPSLEKETEVSGSIDETAKENTRTFLSSIYSSLIGSRLSN